MEKEHINLFLIKMIKEIKYSKLKVSLSNLIPIDKLRVIK